MAAQCSATARTLGYPVPCPGELPARAHPTVFGAGPCADRDVWIGVGCGDETDRVLASIEFPSPERDVPGHLVIYGAPTEQAATALIFVGEPDGTALPLTPTGQAIVAGVRAELYDVPPDSSSAFSGHVVAVWTYEGHTYAAGVHGHGAASRALNDKLLRSIRMVWP